MNLADLKSPVVIPVLVVFAAGWLAIYLKSPVFIPILAVFVAGGLGMYWIVNNRVSAAEATTLALNGQQSTALQEITSQLTTLNKTLRQLEERTRSQSVLLDILRDEIKQLRAAGASQE